jgi:hypothetical protein
MAAYDALPERVRRALYNAAHPWAPTWCTSRLYRNRWTEDRVIRRLAEADARKRAERELELISLEA